MLFPLNLFIPDLSVSCFSFSLSLCFPSVSLSLSVCLSICLFLSLCLSHCLSVSLSGSVSLSLCIFFFLSFCMSVSLSISLSLYVSYYPSLLYRKGLYLFGVQDEIPELTIIINFLSLSLSSLCLSLCLSLSLSHIINAYICLELMMTIPELATIINTEAVRGKENIFSLSWNRIYKLESGYFENKPGSVCTHSPLNTLYIHASFKHAGYWWALSSESYILWFCWYASPPPPKDFQKVSFFCNGWNNFI